MKMLKVLSRFLTVRLSTWKTRTGFGRAFGMRMASLNENCVDSRLGRKSEKSRPDLLPISVRGVIPTTLQVIQNQAHRAMCRAEAQTLDLGCFDWQSRLRSGKSTTDIPNNFVVSYICELPA